MTDQHNSLDNDGMSETEDSSVPSKLKPNLTRSLVGNKNSVEGILQHWKEIDIESKRNQWDMQATEITDNKDARLSSRKKLAEQTKNFKKQPDEEKIKNFGGLLKLYQDEIDQLTKRCKFSETAFLSTYKVLAEAPDPEQSLNSSKARVAELELENKKYKTELEEFKKDFQEIQNQEVTIRHLEDKIAEYEQKMTTIIEDKVKTSETRLRADHQQTLDILRDREQELKKQLSQAQEELSRVQHSFEVTQSELMDLKARYDERQIGKQSEADMLVDELERARSRILSLEREKEKWSENNEFIKANQLSNILTSTTSTDLELEITQKDIEISHLKEYIQKLESQVHGTTDNFQMEISLLNTQLQHERAKLDALQSTLQAKPSPEEYAELQSQLEVFKKALEYTDNTSADANSTVEKLLKDKNRKLETDNMQLKASVAEQAEQNKILTTQLAQFAKNEQEFKQTILKLEEDISRGYSNKSNENLSDLIYTTSTPKKGQSKANTEETSMLQVVCNQRDRFKQRIAELEKENKELQHKMDTTNNEMKSLKNDNIKLYEKIKYLQSYGSISQGRLSDIESNKREDELDSRYSKLYEDSVNPFLIFNRKEKYRRYKELNPAEKVILNSGRFFLSTKSSRIFLFFYSVLLHVLVFALVYKIAHVTTCLKD